MKKRLLLLFISLTFAFTLMSFGISQKAEAATCTFPNDVIVSPGDGKLLSHQASDFAFGQYFLEENNSGDLSLLGISFEALPGFRRGFRRGFTGQSARLKTGFFVNEEAISGQKRTITEKIFDVAGRTVCEGAFTVTAQ